MPVPRFAFGLAVVVLLPLLQPATWMVRADGIGPIRIGTRIGAVAKSLNATASIDRIEPDDACGQATLSTAPRGVSFMLEGDTIVRVDVDTVGVNTVEGIGVGATEAEVKARYKGLVRVKEHPYEGPEGHYLIVDRPGSARYRLLFETDGKKVTRYRVGRRAEVDLIEGCA